MSMIRNSLVRQARLFSTVPAYRKTFTESATDVLKNANQAIGKAAAAGIEKGEQATQSAKETVSSKMPESEGEVKGKASELAGQAKGKANEVAGQAKGKAAEVEGKMS